VGETTASALAVQARQEMGVMDEALLAERAQAVIGKTAVVARASSKAQAVTMAATAVQARRAWVAKTKTVTAAIVA